MRMVQYNTGLRNLCPLERDAKELGALRPGHQNFTKWTDLLQPGTGKLVITTNTKIPSNSWQAHIQNGRLLDPDGTPERFMLGIQS